MLVMLKVIITLFFVILLPLPVMAGNQLGGHDSPYLAMHGNDPVDWQSWSAEVLARAKKENKLVFVSIGYFSCHWCHVMQRESYSNKKIAKILNENFISVKVDRELNPALDAYLIDFVTRTRGSAGWPLNVFLTPEGHPLVGMTYLPADRFMALLQDLQSKWQLSPAYYKQAASRAARDMAGKAAKPEQALSKQNAERYEFILISQALQLADEMSGGFGQQTKFPMVPQLNGLLNAYKRNSNPRVKKILVTTLDSMSTQGLRDHLGGGFYRYTVDPGWQNPHFEKMLYDNALLAHLYLRASKILNRPDYEAVARETLDFMISEMLGPKGAMVASFSAVDDANVEGGYYLWENETLTKILNANELKLLKQLWGIEGHSNFEAGHLPRLQATLSESAKELKLDDREVQSLYDSARKKLLKARSLRKLPVDGKYLAAWNGLALRALVEGAKLEGGEKYKLAAKKIRDYFVNILWDGERLWRARGNSGELGQAGLEDYAFGAQGLLAWAQLVEDVPDGADFQLAKRWINDAWARFYDKTGWRLSDQTLLPTGYGVPFLDESPLPSPSAVLLHISDTLAKQTGDKVLKEKVNSGMNAGHSQLTQVAFDYPTQVSTLIDFSTGK
jgi:uncharacterized protein YyaL (SSP411 family)